MEETLDCGLCDKPGSFKDAAETLSVQAQVERFKEHFFTVWRCGSCGSIHSKEKADLDLYYRHYPLKQHELNFFTRLAYRNLLKQLKASGLRQEDSVLDFGCGRGLFVAFLREKNFSATGYDPFINEYSDKEVLRSSYNFVTCMDVIEHVTDPAATAAELASLVRPGGFLAISTPNADGIDLQKAGSPDAELSQPYHRHIFSEEALKQMIFKNGFRVKSVSHRFYYDTPFPFVNTRFMWSYMNQKGGVLDALVRPLDFKYIYSSPKLLAKAFLGYFFPAKKNILIIFEKIT